MRQIKYIVLHCSATKEGVPFGIEDIDRWHRQRGFRKVGYHYVIEIDGEIRTSRAAMPTASASAISEDWMPTAPPKTPAPRNRRHRCSTCCSNFGSSSLMP